MRGVKPEMGSKGGKVACVLCGCRTQTVLLDRPDYEFGIEDRLPYHRCSDCGLVFASPICEEKIPSFYQSYSTHKGPRDSYLARRERAQILAEIIEAAGDARDAAILDYGCGNGTLLAGLRDAGFCNLTGYDFDAKARQAARAAGAHVVDTEADLRGNFDVVTLNHVVEHLVEPVEQLARFAALLRPGGLLVVRTPNAASFLARLTGERWRGWETPRHLHVFTPLSARKLIDRVPALKLERQFTSNAKFFGIFHESIGARQPKVLRHLAAFLTAGLMRLIGGRGLEEELVVIARAASAKRMEGQPG